MVNNKNNKSNDKIIDSEKKAKTNTFEICL